MLTKLQTQQMQSADLQEIRESTDPKWLLSQLKHSLDISVSHVVRMAAIVRRLEELDVTVDIKLAPLPYLRKIAYGNMLPELYVALEGNSRLLSKAGALPTPDQERVARNEPLKVMGLNGDFRMVPVMSMTPTEVNQVFATGRIRDDAEQVGYLRERLQRIEAEAPDEPIVKLSRKRKGIVVGVTFISLVELEHYVKQLRDS